MSDAAVNGAFRSLTELDIGFNYIGDDGLKTFARRCTEGAFASLRKFNFSTNKIGPLGMQEFSTALMGGALNNVDQLIISCTEDALKPFIKAIQSGAMPSLNKFRTDEWFGSSAIEDDLNDLHDVCKRRQITWYR